MDSSVDHKSSIGAVFFDLDRTIIAKSSALAFGRPFYRGALIGIGDVVRATCARMFRLPGSDHVRVDRLRRYIAEPCSGWSAQQVTAIVDEAAPALIDSRAYPEALELISDHQAEGREVIVVSSAGADVVEPISRMVGADRVIATRMVVADGRYTGQIAFCAHGSGKVRAMREPARTSGYALADCHAYGDSITDLPMLEAVGHPHAVNPDGALRRIAESRGWPVLEFRPPAGPATGARGAVLATAAAGCALGAWYALHRRRAMATA